MGEIDLEFRLAPGRAEIMRAALVDDPVRRRLRVDGHAANRIGYPVPMLRPEAVMRSVLDPAG